MNVILLLIPLSLVLLGAGVYAFFWAIDHAQFDDLETPALMPLTEDHRETPSDVQH
jgi:cbb3-type cytochrome oxidase maturation protein